MCNYIGVRLDKGKYRADIRVNGKRLFLGYFSNDVDAARAYNKAIEDNKLDRAKNTITITTTPVAPKATTGTTKEVNSRTVVDEKKSDTLYHLSRVVLETAPIGTTMGVSDLLNMLRKLSNEEGVYISGVPFIYANGKWVQQLTYEMVKPVFWDTVTVLRRNGMALRDGLQTQGRNTWSVVTRTSY